MIIVRKTSARTVFSSSWTRREQAEKLGEWQNQPPVSTLLGIIREIAAKCDTRHRLVVDIESRPESENGDSLSGLVLNRCLDSIYEKEKHPLNPCGVWYLGHVK